MRSVLTCLGIIIGIGAVIAMVEIGQGSAHAIAHTIETLGAGVVQGGIAGILLGRGVSIGVTALLAWPTLPSLPAVIAAVGVSVGVGIVFGYYPAWKA